MWLSVFKPPVALLLTAWVTCVSADFVLYPRYDEEAMIASFALSAPCLAALNATVQCDEASIYLLRGGADVHYWTQENVTNLCTSTCLTSLSSWRSNVDTVCADETTIQAGVIVRAKALPLSFTYPTELVCMQDSEDNWCFLESQEWTGSDYIRWEPTMCDPNNEDEEDWVAPECLDPDFDLDSLDSDMTSLNNLYDEELRCSECFLKLYRQRLMNPWLADGTFTEYMIDEFDSLQANCSTTLPYTTYTSTLFVDLVTEMSTATPTPTPTSSESGASSTSVPPTVTPTCIGQIVEPVENWLTCNDLSDTYGVSTGDARVLTGHSDCFFEEDVCLPLPCELDIIWDMPTCEQLAERYSNSTHTITVNQLLSWNPNLQGTCDRLAMGQRVCKSAPGGSFVPPTATIIAPGATGSPTYYEPAVPAHPTQVGTAEECGHYYLVVAGDDCSTVCLRFGLNFTQLQDLNTYLNNACTNLWLGYEVCVAPVTETPPVVSTDGTCGPGVTCVGSTFGDCCSPHGYCGSGVEYCGGGGDPETTDGSCGPDNGGTVCTALFGECCSIYGWCGNGATYCGPGNCYSGNCDPDEGGPSLDGSCGPNYAGNKVCTGTHFGDCCSIYGFCGSGSAYCSGANCYSGACTP